jgi:hypothetical protein
VTLLNVDLSTVTTATDVVIGLGDPLEEIVHLEFQSSAAAWKHADVLGYHALLFAHNHVPVHSIVILLRPEAAHSNMSGEIRYAPRPGRGSMDFSYEIVRLWLPVGGTALRRPGRLAPGDARPITRSTFVGRRFN